MNNGICRLCWRHAESQRASRQPIDPLVANRHGQQLFLADLHRLAGARTAPREHGAAREPRPVDRGQLRLFDPRRPIVHPRLGELEQLAHDHTTAHGWSPGHAVRLLTAVRKVAVTHAGDRRIKASAVAALLRPTQLPIRHTIDLLAAAQMLDDDRAPAIEAWFERHLVGLPTPMADELRIWFDVLHRGATTAPRSHPRSPTTIKLRLGWALPTLHHWSDQGHQSLREISRADITAALPPGGQTRTTLGLALRSIFDTLKARKVIFVNPITRTDVGEIERRQPLPVDLDRLRTALNSPDPARAALTALIAFHGLRNTQLRALHLTDVRDGRLHLEPRALPLAAPVISRLSTYLDHRTARWPNSINPHLFITTRTAIATDPASPIWISRTLDIPASALRQDRILDEAIATGGDVRRLCDLFAITVKTAVHYASIAQHPDLDG